MKPIHDSVTFKKDKALSVYFLMLMSDTSSGYDYWGHETKDTKYSETQKVWSDIVFEIIYCW